MQHTLQTLKARIDTLLSKAVQQLDTPPKLQDAMRHSLLAPGKRIRPLLVYTTGLSLEAKLASLDAPAIAIECIHTYSLIHDDLPAMDDAALRRGQPSCHTAHGEAMAILAGDSLLTWAFEHLTDTHNSPSTQSQLITYLAKASGPTGMVAGQCLDLQGANNIKNLKHMHRLKTGALIAACLAMGCTVAGTTWNTNWQQLADDLGLAYQLQDDLMDRHGCTITMGKPTGQDRRHSKATASDLSCDQLSQQLLEDTQQRIQSAFAELQLTDSPLAVCIASIMKRTH